MNYAFNVLWIENDYEWSSATKQSIIDIIEDHFLIPIITIKDNLSEEEIPEKNQYDLILMDYKLSDNQTGDQLIKQVRSNNILTDVLFYSAHYREMIKIVSEMPAPMDGVYYSDRDDNVFSEKLKDLIDKIVQRTENIIHLRGFVLENTSNFENVVMEILVDSWDKVKEDSKSRLLEYLDKIPQRKIDHINSQYTKISKKQNKFIAAVADDHFLSNFDRMNILADLFDILKNEYGFDHEDKYENFPEKYTDELGTYRNKLGHCKDGKIVIKGKTINVDQNLHRTLRRVVKKYIDTFTELKEFISGIN
jgi:CheY-like chemotaxis protein